MWKRQREKNLRVKLGAWKCWLGFSFVSSFSGISTFVGYLMPKPSLLKDSSRKWWRVWHVKEKNVIDYIYIYIYIREREREREKERGKKNQSERKRERERKNIWNIYFSFLDQSVSFYYFFSICHSRPLFFFFCWSFLLNYTRTYPETKLNFDLFIVSWFWPIK